MRERERGGGGGERGGREREREREGGGGERERERERQREGGFYLEHAYNFLYNGHVLTTYLCNGPRPRLVQLDSSYTRMT